ncbi:MAG: hypothetical protein SGI72_15665 [Planctomycetota bacterium]|nr:hypothetical protein [Planctomycetota bacterium]
MTHALSTASFFASATLALFSFAPTTSAQTCPDIGPVQTYTNQPGGTYATCNCFVPGEEAGQFFPTSMIPAADYPIQITKIAIGWYSQAGNQGTTIEDSINIYANGAFPNPGALIMSLGAPQLTDGALNEFDVTPQNIVVNSPGFYVTLRFFNTNDGTVVPPATTPTMVSDSPIDGCTANRNVVKVTSPFSGWFNFCAPFFPGGSGDWMMHVKYKKVSCSGGGGFIGSTYCFGDGSGATLCPCDPGQAGGVGEGCAHSSGTGAKLQATGLASVSGDTVALTATNLISSTAILFFQGTLKQNAGNGTAFGDGLLCVSGTITRLGVKFASGGIANFGAGVGADPLLSIQGGIPVNGAVRRYQGWYRDSASFCTAATFNLTSALELTWTP